MRDSSSPDSSLREHHEQRFVMNLEQLKQNHGGRIRKDTEPNRHGDVRRKRWSHSEGTTPNNFIEGIKSDLISYG